jgi:hypothetical protein
MCVSVFFHLFILHFQHCSTVTLHNTQSQKVAQDMAEKIDKLEVRKHDFLTSGSHTGTCNRVVIQWVRLGIVKVEKIFKVGPHF